MRLRHEATKVWDSVNNFANWYSDNYLVDEDSASNLVKIEKALTLISGVIQDCDNKLNQPSNKN